MKKNYKTIESKITKFIKEQVGGKTAVIGLSGGVDSSVVAYLAVKALGRKKVVGISTPSHANTRQDLELAKKVSKELKIVHRGIEIEPIIKSFGKYTPLYRDRFSRGNLTARIRMCILYGISNDLDGIVIGTGNKTELWLGYFTKYGDGATDILPIGDLFKTEVWAMAEYLGVPKEIIKRPPTAGLWPGQEDEKELGMTYKKIDLLLEKAENGKKIEVKERADMLKIKKLISRSQHKLSPPPICRL